jgi:hypothetical protein
MACSRDLSDEKATVAEAEHRTGRRAEGMVGAAGRSSSTDVNGARRIGTGHSAAAISTVESS